VSLQTRRELDWGRADQRPTDVELNLGVCRQPDLLGARGSGTHYYGA
jgi:hypothetical protein